MDRIRQSLFKRCPSPLPDEYKVPHKRIRISSPPAMHDNWRERPTQTQDKRGSRLAATSSSKTPSSKYHGLASAPSESIEKDSATSSLPPKLLVLDLNGALVLRSARPPPSAYREHDSKEPGAPRPRLVYPRPYMPAFLAYLFHDSTRSWLETMVWSSAMPASVDDMVGKAFGERRAMLKAIWARDTLGLSKGAYNNKVDTIKDLEKPWAALPILQREGGSSDKPGSELYSATSTVLLDDSPKKAKLQPWNHVCIQEYTPKMRFRDEAIFRGTQPANTTSNHRIHASPESSSAAIPPSASSQPASQSTAAPSVPTTPASHISVYDETLLAVVGILDRLKLETNVASWIKSGGLFSIPALVPPPSSSAPASDAVDQLQNAVKLDSGPASSATAVDTSHKTSTIAEEDGSASELKLVVHTAQEEVLDPQEAKKARRKAKKEMKRAKKAGLNVENTSIIQPTASAALPNPSSASPPSSQPGNAVNSSTADPTDLLDPEARKLAKKARKNERKAERKEKAAERAGKQAVDTAGADDSTPAVEIREGPELVVHPAPQAPLHASASASSVISSTLPTSTGLASLLHPSTSSSASTMWFDHPAVFGHWVAEGRRALLALGINVSAEDGGRWRGDGFVASGTTSRRSSPEVGR